MVTNQEGIGELKQIRVRQTDGREFMDDLRREIRDGARRFADRRIRRGFLPAPGKSGNPEGAGFPLVGQHPASPGRQLQLGGLALRPEPGAEIPQRAREPGPL